MAVIVVLGAGRMGTAICTPFLDRGHQVRLVGTHLDGEFIEALRRTGIHPGLEHPLPKGASYFRFEEAEAAFDGAEMIVLGVSSFGIPWASQQLDRLLPKPLPLLTVTKGLAWDGSSFRLLPDVLVEGMSSSLRTGLRPVAVTGPCVAGELIRKRDTTVTFTSRKVDDAELWAGAVHTPYYNVWTSIDFIGCEVAAALKNAYAVGIGMAAGLLERSRDADAPADPPGVAAHNVEAALFAEAVAEMSDLARLAGGDRRTPFGMTGVGDLMVTLFARSVRLGRALGSGQSYEEALRANPGVTFEGAATIEVLGRALADLDAAQRIHPRQLPLMRQLVAVIHGAPARISFERFFS